MFLLYNGQLLSEEEVALPLSNRAFQYNDGFFETIMLENGKLRLWEEHRARMREASLALHLEMGEEFWNPDFEKQVGHLTEKNGCGALTRIKLKLWRGGEGLYTPQTDKAHWLATAQAALPPSEAPLHTGICQSVRTIPSAFSSFKGINAPVYVLASREKVARHLDDLIILDPQGHVAELTHSSLFWTKGQNLFTPALTTGCVNGVFRRKLVGWANAYGWAVQEVNAPPAQLLAADAVFAGNVTGLRALASIGKDRLPHRPDIIQEFKKAVFKI